MLVIARKPDQSVYIGDMVLTVTDVDFDRRQVVLNVAQIKRRLNEAILVGDVSVMVSSFDQVNREVRLAIAAPRTIPIWREELLNRADRLDRIEERHD
jgi:sRNA-binding carbon storage regulator CsrA